jgi:hypothetical protein
VSQSLRVSLAAIVVAASWLALSVATASLIVAKWGGHGSFAFIVIVSLLALLGAAVGAASFAFDGSRNWSVVRRATASWAAACGPFCVYAVVGGTRLDKTWETFLFTCGFALIGFAIAVTSAWLGARALARSPRGAA